ASYLARLRKGEKNSQQKKEKAPLLEYTANPLHILPTPYLPQKQADLVPLWG
ncbi:uncharacterized protein METZ01_LOCUS299763, partial [marine metagenome]